MLGEIIERQAGSLANVTDVLRNVGEASPRPSSRPGDASGAKDEPGLVLRSLLTIGRPKFECTARTLLGKLLICVVPLRPDVSLHKFGDGMRSLPCVHPWARYIAVTSYLWFKVVFRVPSSGACNLSLCVFWRPITCGYLD